MANKKRKSRKRVILGRLATLAFLALIIYVMLVPVRIYLGGKKDDLRTADCIVVMGARQNNGKPSPVFEGRLRYGVELYRKGYAEKIIFTGGKMPGDNFTESETGKMYALKHGVPATDILTEGESRDTYASLDRVKALMKEHGLKSAVIVSDPFHMFRLRKMAKELGIRAYVCPTPYSKARSREVKWRYLKHEWQGYIYYKFFTRFLPFRPF